MRRIALLLGGVAALVVAVLVAGAILLPRYVDTPATRERISAAVREASGRELHYASLTAGLLPPRLEVKEPVVAGEAPDAPPLFAADTVALRVALLPLLSGTLVLQSLDVEGARIHLVRSPPKAAETPAGTAEGTAPLPEAGQATAPAEPAAAPRLGIERLRLADARITLEDRTLSPPATLVLEHLDAKARRAGAFDRVSFEASAQLASGGALTLQGTVDADAAVDATATLGKVDTKAFVPWLAGAKKPKDLSGFLAGTVHAKLEETTLNSVEMKLVLEEASVEIESVSLRGRLTLTADLAPLEGGLGGAFEIDVTEGELAYGNAFRKPPGTAATTSGTLKTGVDGTLQVDELRVKIKNFEAQGSLRSGATTQLALDAPAFDLAGWEALLPGQTDLVLGGRLALQGLRVTTAPTRVDGAVVLEGVQVGVPGRPPVALQGRLVGAGDALRSERLVLEVAGQAIALDIAVAPLGGDAVGNLVASGRDIESAALLGAFSKSDAPVSGPLRFDARFRAPLGGPLPLLEVVSGDLDLDIEPGRLRGFSMLKDTIDRSGPVVQAAVSAGQAFGGRDLKHMYSDEFQSLSVRAKLAAGVATFDPLRVVRDTHRIDLRGRVKLATRGLDARGEIVFPSGKSSGALQGQTLPISHIGGTLDDPKVELSSQDVAAMVAALSGAALQGKLGGLIEKLGGSKGGSPLDAIQGFFGGKRKRSP